MSEVGLDIRKKIFFFYDECGETPEQLAQSSCGYLIPGSVQGQAVWGFEKHGLVKYIETELHDL